MMRCLFLHLALALSFLSQASPWFNFDDYEIEYIYTGLQKHCKILDLRYSKSPNSLWMLESIKDQIEGPNLSKECNFYLEKLENKILDSFDKNILIGFQSEVDNLYLQENGFRYYEKIMHI